jgi:predicted membrane protein
MHLWPLFWGVFFILIGINIILKTFFNFSIPFFRVAFALLIIFIGIKIMFPSVCTGGWKTSPAVDEKTTVFGEQAISGDKAEGEHSVVFGSVRLDLTKVDVSKETVNVKVDAVFGGAGIRIDPAMPVKIIGSAVFGGILMPNGNSSVFGTTYYQSESYKDGQPHLEMTVNAVFGGVEIKK